MKRLIEDNARRSMNAKRVAEEDHGVIMSEADTPMPSISDTYKPERINSDMIFDRISQFRTHQAQRGGLKRSSSSSTKKFVSLTASRSQLPTIGEEKSENPYLKKLLDDQR